jgi:hypothetical protein
MVRTENVMSINCHAVDKQRQRWRKGQICSEQAEMSVNNPNKLSSPLCGNVRYVGAAL